MQEISRSEDERNKEKSLFHLGGGTGTGGSA